MVDYLDRLPKPNTEKPAEPAGAANATEAADTENPFLTAREQLLGKLRFTADARGLDEAALVNLAGTRYSAESLDELKDGEIADFESHIRKNYEPAAASGGH